MTRLLLDRPARALCGLLWIAAWGLVATLLLTPLPVAPPPGGDLVAHFLLFGTMAFGAVGFSRRPGQLASLALATVALGIALEYAQGFVPTRYTETADAVANGAGALAGYAVALLVLHLVIRPAEPRLRAATS
jgi:VanZ family protein